MDSIPKILQELTNGRLIVLVDDEDRENEGDLVCAAEFATPANINFMLREARGLLCLALTAQRCDELELTPQAQVNTAQRSTAFTVSVDAHQRFGVTTGVSASDRAATIRVCLDPSTKPADLARPGHLQPLRARPGGVLVRPGQTEGSIDLCRLAGLQPAAVIIEVMNDDGSMARLPDLQKLCEKHQLKMCSIAGLIEHRLGREHLVERVESAPIDTPAGPFTLTAYRSVVDAMPHVALTHGLTTGEVVDEPVLVRMHSQNLLGDVFGDVTQPSGQTLHTAMRMIQRAGRGAIVYLRHDHMGTGLLQRLQRRHDASDDHDETRLGEHQPNPGTRPPTYHGAYGIGSQILRDLGLRKLRLITEHPFQPNALSGFGLEIVDFVPPKV